MSNKEPRDALGARDGETLLDAAKRVVRERDEARADLARSVAAWEAAGMQGRTAHDAMLALVKERDEERMRARCFEQAHAEAEADVRELRARIAELEARRWNP